MLEIRKLAINCIDTSLRVLITYQLKLAALSQIPAAIQYNLEQIQEH